MKKFLEADCFCHLAFDGREAIDAFEVTPGYRSFARMMAEERARRPAALRDVLELPAESCRLAG